MNNHFSSWKVPTTLVATLLFGLNQVPAAGQRAPFASPPPGSGPTPMAPYGQSGGCSEEPAQFHKCAMAKAKEFNPPRTPDGKPDFRGVWARIAVRNAENIEEHPETFDGSGGTSAIVDPPDGRIPYQPWAATRRDTHFVTYMNPVAYCFPAGSPKQAYSAGAFEVLQTPGYVFIANDYAHAHRIIPTDPRPPIGQNVRFYGGRSQGRWEGNTLVVDITNQKARTWLDHVGNFFSENARVVERFTMIHPDVIHYQATIEDSTVYTRPWTMALGWRRNPEAGYEMWENACWEGVSSGALQRLDHGLQPYRGASPK